MKDAIPPAPRLTESRHSYLREAGMLPGTKVIQRCREVEAAMSMLDDHVSTVAVNKIFAKASGESPMLLNAVDDLVQLSYRLRRDASWVVRELIDAVQALHLAADEAERRAKIAEYEARASRAALSRHYELPTESALSNDILFGDWVYIIRDGAEAVVYVGMSTNVLSRLGQHRVQRWFPPDGSVELVRCDSREDALRVEGELIRHFDPPQNVAGRVK